MEKTVKITIVILRDKTLADGGQMVIQYPIVAEHIRITKERYAQVGVKIDVTGVEVQDPPQGVNLADGLLLSRPDGSLVSEETQNLIETLGTTAVSDIHIFYVNFLHRSGTSGPHGYAFNEGPGEINGDQSIFAYNAFVSALKTNESIQRGGLVLAHELGHLLRNSGHASTSGLVPETQLMIPYPQPDGIMGGKRLHISDHGCPVN